MDVGTVADVTCEALAHELTSVQRGQLWALVLKMRRSVARSVTPGSDPEYDDDVLALQELLYRCGLVLPFDTGSWMEDTAFGRRRLMRHLSVVDAIRYVTALVRGERFCPGGFGEAVDDGSLLDAIEVVLHAGGDPRSLAS